MAKIGNWGSYIKFRTGDEVMTFTNFTRTTAARISEHSMIGAKPKIEYLGQGLQEVSFTMELNAFLGVRPRTVEERLIRMVGKTAPLVVGGKKIMSRAMLVSLSNAYDIVLSRGEILSMKINVKMKEYQ